MRFSAPRALVRLLGFTVLVSGLLGPYALMLALRPKQRHRVARLFYLGCLKLTGIRVNVSGWPARDVAIYAANHASYLDIPVLGALVSHGVFVAKNEVAGWPLFGFLARLSRTEFITREGAHAPAQCRQLARRINRGASLILFPEGTSTDGAGVRPFKSALFSSLDEVAPVAWAQPVTIAYTRHKQGETLSQPSRELFTWFGDMTLLPHLINVFGIEGCEVDVIFHAPVRADGFDSRKALARYCQAKVAEGLADAIGLPEYDVIEEQAVHAVG